MTHNDKYRLAVDAIQDVAEDFSVPSSEVELDLHRLRDNIDLALSLFTKNVATATCPRCEHSGGEHYSTCIYYKR